MDVKPINDIDASVKISKEARLGPTKIEELKQARLLVPDHDGLYRFKLMSWAQKLAFLIHSGWSVEEIKNWANGRFETGVNSQWPPDRSLWKLD